MRRLIYTHASALRSILCFIDPVNTPKISYDNDALIEPLIKKIKDVVGDYDGTQSVMIVFDNEDDLYRQFQGICYKIKNIFNHMVFLNEFTRKEYIGLF